MPERPERERPDRRPRNDPNATAGPRRQSGGARSVPRGRQPAAPPRADQAAVAGNGRPKRTTRLPPPELPPAAAPGDLPREVLAEFRELPPERRDTLARHLASAGALLAEDPEAAYQHAAYVRQFASRLASVREAAGIAAYRTGRYAEALNDLRAFARMTGDPRHLPLMADCERGVGRPERALTLARGQDAGRLGLAERIELRIVASGARRDLGEFEASLVELRGPELDSTAVAPWTPRLWYAYAEALLGVGDRAGAVEWFTSAAAVDAYGQTDADSRLAALAD